MSTQSATGMNKRSFKAKVRHNKKRMKSFLTRVEKKAPRGLDAIAVAIDKEVWQETDCLSCANCCKSMTPTFNTKDIKRISAHFNMTPALFKETYLNYEKKDKDWQNQRMPCQWLNLEDNKCSIYEIRPADCSGYPHLTKKKMVDYMHVHKQNIEYCPATYKMVEKMMERAILG